MRSIRLPSPALVLAIIAVFAACTGGAFAAGKISGGQIKDGSITGKDIRNDSLSGADIKGQVRGPTGPEGPKGAKGDQGPAGPAGPVASGGGAPALTYVYAIETIAADGQTVRANCPAGQVVIGGGYETRDTLDRTPTGSGPASTPTSDLLTAWDVVIPPAGVRQSEITVRSIAICTTPGSVIQVPPAPVP
jgi:hypothetical protein